ncbi:hypothetical protein [Flavobacterium sp. C4GT6]|uniref:hypothetical protein n=1 Tax=Flavobacterium sp. C4GT6 TaxID=3103818 RepID=UPI002ED203E8
MSEVFESIFKYLALALTSWFAVEPYFSNKKKKKKKKKKKQKKRTKLGKFFDGNGKLFVILISILIAFILQILSDNVQNDKEENLREQLSSQDLQLKGQKRKTDSIYNLLANTRDSITNSIEFNKVNFDSVNLALFRANSLNSKLIDDVYKYKKQTVSAIDGSGYPVVHLVNFEKNNLTFGLEVKNGYALYETDVDMYKMEDLAQCYDFKKKDTVISYECNNSYVRQLAIGSNYYKNRTYNFTYLLNIKYLPQFFTFRTSSRHSVFIQYSILYYDKDKHIPIHSYQIYRLDANHEYVFIEQDGVKYDQEVWEDHFFYKRRVRILRNNNID